MNPLQAYLATDTVSFSNQLLQSSTACAFATDIDPSILQQADVWTAQVFLGGSEIQNSPVNVSAPSIPLSAGLSFGLNGKNQQMQPCNGTSACQTYFEVSLLLGLHSRLDAI